MELQRLGAATSFEASSDRPEGLWLNETLSVAKCGMKPLTGVEASNPCPPKNELAAPPR